MKRTRGQTSYTLETSAENAGTARSVGNMEINIRNRLCIVMIIIVMMEATYDVACVKNW